MGERKSPVATRIKKGAMDQISEYKRVGKYVAKQLKNSPKDMKAELRHAKRVIKSKNLKEHLKEAGRNFKKSLSDTGDQLKRVNRRDRGSRVRNERYK